MLTDLVAVQLPAKHPHTESFTQSRRNLKVRESGASPYRVGDHVILRDQCLRRYG